MSWTVVTVKTAGNQDFFELTDAATQPTVAGGLSPLACSPGQNEFMSFRQQPAAPEISAKVGKELWKALESDDRVREQLTFLFGDGGALFIADVSAESQALPWETLCRPDGRFVALEAKLALGRTVARVEAKKLRSYTYDSPLRVLAVLAAAGGAAKDTAIEEWTSLSTALFADPEIECDLRVIGCDADVKTAVEAFDQPAVADGATPRFQFLDADKIKKAVKSFQPHILHFFCHGFVEPEPTLEFATRRDQALASDRGSETLNAEELADVVDIDHSLWLVNLNCCLGAAATDSSQPLAREIVREGVPAVTAMQEPIDRRDAHLFSRSFYQSFLGQIKAALDQPAPHRLSVPEALREPRKDLHDSHKAQHGPPANCKEWSLPVVYVHYEPFELDGRTAPGLDPQRILQIRSELAQLGKAREEMSRLDLPPEVIAGIDQKIGALEAELRQ